MKKTTINYYMDYQTGRIYVAPHYTKEKTKAN